MAVGVRMQRQQIPLPQRQEVHIRHQRALLRYGCVRPMSCSAELRTQRARMRKRMAQNICVRARTCKPIDIPQ
jgi:hypothetical protein